MRPLAALALLILVCGCVKGPENNGAATTTTLGAATTGSASERDASCKYYGESLRLVLDKANYCSKDEDCTYTEEYYRCSVTGCQSLVNKGANLTSADDAAGKYDAGCEPATCNMMCPRPPTPSEVRCVDGVCADVRYPAEKPDSERSCGEAESWLKGRLEVGNQCDADSDCVVSTEFGCPFGCYRLLNKDANLNKFREDVQAYRVRCETCTYKCAPPPNGKDIRCVSGRCAEERHETTTTLPPAGATGMIRTCKYTMAPAKTCYCLETRERGCEIADWSAVGDLAYAVNRTVEYEGMRENLHCTRMIPCNINLTSIRIAG
jgi:hypothetical protein